MSLPRYPKYKDSGLKWTHQVPEHWEVLLLRRCILEHRQGYYSQEDYVDSGLKLLRITDLRESGKIDFTGCPRVKDRADVKPFLLQPADFVFARTGGAGTFGFVELLEERVIYASYLIRFRFSNDCCPDFLKFLFLSHSFQEGLRQNIHGGVNQNIHAEDIKSQRIALPPSSEQAAIAAFLDEQTNALDVLIEEQQRLIVLLKKKRQAVISHAVTKGLNPHVPVKPSGIDWLGDIPAHWVMRPVKSFARICNGSTPSRETPGYWAEEGFPWLSSTAVNQENIWEANEFVTDRAMAECTLPKIVPPAVLIGITGQGRTRGMASTLRIEATINQHVAAVVPFNPNLHVEYVRRFFDMAYGILRSDSEGGGSTKAAITCEQIANLRVCVPPENEQMQIAQFLASESERVATLIDHASRAIELLQERRSALISAAVTGKIDVSQAVEECVA